MDKKHVLFLVTAVFSLLCCILMLPLKTKAAGLAAGIAPAVISIEAEQGSTAAANFSLENFSDEPLTLEVSYKEFTASDQADGQIKFISSSAAFTQLLPHVSIIENGKPVTQITLAPRQKKKLQLHIEAEKGLPAQDYTFTVIFSTQPSVSGVSGSGSYTLLRGALGMNVLLSLGERNSQAVIETYTAPVFVKEGPVPFTVKIYNPGKHFITSSGAIQISNVFGQHLGRIPLPEMHILAETPRFYSGTETQTEKTTVTNMTNVSWPEKALFGVYRATLTLSVDKNGPVYTRTIYFAAVPLQALIIIVLAAAIFILIKTRVSKYLSR